MEFAVKGGFTTFAVSCWPMRSSHFFCGGVHGRLASTFFRPATREIPLPDGFGKMLALRSATPSIPQPYPVPVHGSLLGSAMQLREPTKSLDLIADPRVQRPLDQMEHLRFLRRPRARCRGPKAAQSLIRPR